MTAPTHTALCGDCKHQQPVRKEQDQLGAFAFRIAMHRATQGGLFCRGSNTVVANAKAMQTTEVLR